MGQLALQCIHSLLHHCAEVLVKRMNDFRMSIIKPLTPGWIYAGWKRVADDVDMVVAGWDKCGLRCMFDDRKAHTRRHAMLAVSDSSHHLFPLFPNNEISSLPQAVLDGEEDEIEQTRLEREYDDGEEPDNITEERTRSILSFFRASPPTEPTVAEPPDAAEEPPAKRLCPLFAGAAQKGILQPRQQG